MGICRTAWGSRASVICPSNGRGNTKSLDLPHINPTFGPAAGGRAKQVDPRPRLAECRTPAPDPHSNGVSTTRFSVSGKQKIAVGDDGDIDSDLDGRERPETWVSDQGSWSDSNPSSPHQNARKIS